MSLPEVSIDRPAKLPLGALVGSAYSIYFRNLKSVFKIAWLWVILAAPLAGFAWWHHFSFFAQLVAAHPDAAKLGPNGAISIATTHFPWTLAALLYGSHILLSAGAASVAVAWHRKILLNERPALSVSNVVSSNYWRYVGTFLLMMLAAFIPWFVITLVAVSSITAFAMNVKVAGPLVIGVVFVPGIIVAGYLLRLELLLPARAIGDRGLTFRQTLAATQGNAWRLGWGFLATLVPPLLLIQLIVMFVIGNYTPDKFLNPHFIMMFAVVEALSVAFYILIAPIHIGFLSLAYQYLLLPGNSGARPYIRAVPPTPLQKSNQRYLVVALLIAVFVAIVINWVTLRRSDAPTSSALITTPSTPQNSPPGSTLTSPTRSFPEQSNRTGQKTSEPFIGLPGMPNSSWPATRH